MALCLQCSGATHSAAPVEEASGKQSDRSEEGAATAEEATPPDSESAPADPPAESDTPATPSATKKKKCPELEKSDCEVTTGCAWNSLGKCVEFGPSE
jgi:hypothetical protein